VSLVTPPAAGEAERKSLLDVGCGCGWSSYSFAQAGYATTGVDLNPEAFEPPVTDNLILREGSAIALPFDDESFDIVASYQCLEHIPDPEAALKEMIRVCRRGGVICIAGPNLVTPFLPIKFLAKDMMKRKLKYKRLPNTPRHPYGNTAPEEVMAVFSSTGLLRRKILSTRVQFTMRVPDTRPPFDGDNDACFLCNPTDIIRFFRRENFHVLRKGRHGRPPMSYLFAGGTWVAARKM
jgi:SAM-dependent methyltransferase